MDRAVGEAILQAASSQRLFWVSPLAGHRAVIADVGKGVGTAGGIIKRASHQSRESVDGTEGQLAEMRRRYSAIVLVIGKVDLRGAPSMANE